MCECHIIFSDRADLIVIKEELEKEENSDNEKHNLQRNEENKEN